jgi:hypothetical protein
MNDDAERDIKYYNSTVTLCVNAHLVWNIELSSRTMHS